MTLHLLWTFILIHIVRTSEAFSLELSMNAVPRDQSVKVNCTANANENEEIQSMQLEVNGQRTIFADRIIPQLREDGGASATFTKMVPVKFCFPPLTFHCSGMASNIHNISDTKNEKTVKTFSPGARPVTVPQMRINNQKFSDLKGKYIAENLHIKVECRIQSSSKKDSKNKRAICWQLYRLNSVVPVPKYDPRIHITVKETKVEDCVILSSKFRYQVRRSDKRVRIACYNVPASERSWNKVLACNNKHLCQMSPTYTVMYAVSNKTIELKLTRPMPIDEGSHVLLVCRAEGYPTPMYSWGKMVKGRMVSETRTKGRVRKFRGKRVGKASQLTLDDVSAVSDQGLYICMATNTINKRTYTAIKAIEMLVMDSTHKDIIHGDYETTLSTLSKGNHAVFPVAAGGAAAHEVNQIIYDGGMDIFGYIFVIFAIAVVILFTAGTLYCAIWGLHLPEDIGDEEVRQATEQAGKGLIFEDGSGTIPHGFTVIT